MFYKFLYQIKLIFYLFIIIQLQFLVFLKKISNTYVSQININHFMSTIKLKTRHVMPEILSTPTRGEYNRLWLKQAKCT